MGFDAAPTRSCGITTTTHQIQLSRGHRLPHQRAKTNLITAEPKKNQFV
jgi:hypothetical protein